MRAGGASPDILVLNAGGPPMGGAASTTPEEIEQATGKAEPDEPKKRGRAKKEP